ncbi:MAG: non-canonical purine NTP pyrophosphatase, partial [Smithella sp.]
MKIVFASKNEGKVKEIKAMLAETGIELISLNSFKNVPEIVEDGASFRENALKKARIISEFTGEDVLADDSGLMVDILNGEPGIYSSRYAGPDANDEENNAKLLKNLKKVPADNRTAS